MIIDGHSPETVGGGPFVGLGTGLSNHAGWPFDMLRANGGKGPTVDGLSPETVGSGPFVGLGTG